MILVEIGNLFNRQTMIKIGIFLMGKVESNTAKVREIVLEV